MALELTIEEAVARFNEAAAAARRGERVVITKDGQPLVEMVQPRPKGVVDFAKMAEVRKRLGLEGVTVTLPEDFDDPAFSRRVLGLDPEGS